MSVVSVTFIFLNKYEEAERSAAEAKDLEINKTMAQIISEFESKNANTSIKKIKPRRENCKISFSFFTLSSKCPNLFGIIKKGRRAIGSKTLR